MIMLCIVAAITVQAQVDEKNEIVIQETATQFSNDMHLLEIYNKMKSKSAKVKLKNPIYYKKKSAKLRKTAYILGGTLVGAGLVCTLIGDKEWTDQFKEYYDFNTNQMAFDYDIFHSRYFGLKTKIGLGIVGSGVAIGLPCLLRAGKLSKRSVYSGSLWEKELIFKNGSHLDLGIDAISDNTAYNRTLGLGARYNF